jgi:hypothetical protein
VCSTNATDKFDCSTSECDPKQKGKCDIIKRECAVDATVSIVIGALSTAAVVGIIIAVVACVGLSSGASLAVYNKMGDGDLGAVSNNPLFKPSGNEQVNPLFREG